MFVSGILLWSAFFFWMNIHGGWWGIDYFGTVIFVMVLGIVAGMYQVMKEVNRFTTWLSWLDTFNDDWMPESAWGLQPLKLGSSRQPKRGLFATILCLPKSMR
jgi:hypothetical protein